MRIDFEGRRRHDDDEHRALVVTNDGRSIKFEIQFYVPTEFLNLRCTGRHYIKMLVQHYGPNQPQASFKLNNKPIGDDFYSVMPLNQ